MSDKFENTGENSRSRSARCMHYVGKTLSIAVKVLAVALIAFLVIRMFTSKPPASMKKLIWNENLLSVYTSTDGQTEILTVVSSDSFSTDRMFSVYSIYYIPEAGQLQFTVRYNNRALNYLEEDFPGAKETEGEIYGFRPIKSALAAKGFSFRSGSDCEILLPLYAVLLLSLPCLR